MEKVDRTLLAFAGVILGAAIGVVAILVGVYQMVESSESEVRIEMQRVEVELRAETQRSEAMLRAEMQRSEAALRAEMQRIEAERKAEMQRIEADLRAEIAALSAKMDRFIERVDSRLSEVEREQAWLNAVNELLAQQIQR